MDNEPKPTHVRNWKNYLIAVLAVITTLSWFTRGCERKPIQEDKMETAYQDTIRILRAQEAINEARQDSIYSKATRKRKADSVFIKQQDKRIAAASMRAREAEAKISQITRDEHPEVVAALAAKDTVIQEMQVKVDSLQSSLLTVNKQLVDLQHLDVDEDRIQSQMMQQCETRRQQMGQDLQAANKKAEKVPRLKRVIAWLGAIVVIETAILIVKD
jgi:hypothetical protein